MEVDEAFANRAMRCPTCGQDLKVPKKGEATPVRGVQEVARPGATTVKVDGESVEIVPPLETLAVVSLALGGFAVVACLVICLSGIWPWGIGMFFGAIFSFVGCIMGLRAYQSIRRSRGQRGGKNLAQIGMAGGAGLALIFAVGAIAGLLLYLSRPPCEENMKRISLALRTYADKHDGAFPNKLEALVKDGYLRSSDLTCPAYFVTPGTVTYILTPDINIKKPQWPATLMVLSDGPPYDAHSDKQVRVLLLGDKPETPTVITVPLSTWEGYQKTQVALWNKTLNQIRNPQPATPPPMAAPGAAAPAPGAPVPGAPAPAAPVTPAPATPTPAAPATAPAKAPAAGGK
jgi:hypothetical protein